jgi:hypothetical protein
MTDARTIVSVVSVAIALVCAGWAVYEIKHKPDGSAPAAAARPGAGGGRGPAPISVITAAAEQRAINVGIEAIGTANSN